jgi:HEPN domain-containing protein
VKERKENETIWDLRRRAPAHFWARAENAYTCAKVLFDQKGETHNLALYEGFIRESSIALELILKALIAEQSNAAPPNSHDVFDLSNRANLPKLSSDDLMRLTEVTKFCIGAGVMLRPLQT